METEQIKAVLKSMVDSTDNFEKSEITLKKYFCNEILDKISQLEKDKSNLTYLVADFDNYKKRVAREKTDIINNANKDIILDLLTVVDDMEKIINDINSHSYELSPNERGFSMIHDNILKILEAEGCERIKTSYGDKFNFNIHEAMTTRKCYENERFEEDEICEIYQSGWTLNGKLLRATKVAVIKN